MEKTKTAKDFANNIDILSGVDPSLAYKATAIIQDCKLQDMIKAFYTDLLNNKDTLDAVYFAEQSIAFYDRVLIYYRSKLEEVYKEDLNQEQIDYIMNYMEHIIEGYKALFRNLPCEVESFDVESLRNSMNL